jgi:hypothetical protein
MMSHKWVLLKALEKLEVISFNDFYDWSVVKCCERSADVANLA